MGIDAYKILDVSSSATQEEIKNSYRKLAKKLHPDLNPGNKEAEKKFKEINAAYDILSDPEKRKKYDLGEFNEPPHYGQGDSRHQEGPFYYETQQGAGGRYRSRFGAEHGLDDDFLSSLFNQMGREGRGTDARGQDALYQMDIAFKDAVLGAEREITLPNGKKLLVKIPAGVDTGTKMRIAGQGEPGRGNASAGDAYVQLNVLPSEQFRRRGGNLLSEISISVPEAILGSEIEVPTIDGRVLLKIPPNSSSGLKLRILGKGVPSMKDKKRGDQIVTLKIVLPREVDKEFRDSVEAWNRRQKYDPRK